MEFNSLDVWEPIIFLFVNLMKCKLRENSNFNSRLVAFTDIARACEGTIMCIGFNGT